MVDRKKAWKVDARVAPPIQKEASTIPTGSALGTVEVARPRQFSQSVAVPVRQKSNLSATTTHFEILSHLLGNDRRELKSFGISTALHLIVLLLLAIVWHLPQNGTGSAAFQPQGIAVVQVSAEPSEFQFDAGGDGKDEPIDSPKASSADQAKAALISMPSSDQGPAASTPSTDELLGEFANVTGESALGGPSIESGTGLGSLGTDGLGSSGIGKGLGKGGTTTSVFGIPGTGNSFVYVFDRSDSMNGYGGAPIRAAKRELAQSIESLKSINQFQVIFYNDTPSPFRGSLSNTSQLIFATDTDKSSAVDFVKSIKGAGGTDHEPALRLAIGLAPEVIFFLTDAAIPQLNQGQVNEIVERCNSRGTTIHSIEFGVGQYPSEARWIEELAKRTGGKYRYVDASNLNRN